LALAFILAKPSLVASNSHLAFLQVYFFPHQIFDYDA